MKLPFTLLLFLFLEKFGFSQYHEIEINGRVIDTTKNQQFYNIILFNKSKNKAYFGSPDGSFKIVANCNETVIVSVEGYEKSTIFIEEGNTKPSLYYNIYLQPQTKYLKPIVIHPLKTLQQIKEEREQLTLKESKKMVEGISILQSPITALYERFSKRAQTIKKINEFKYQDEKSKILKELLSLYVNYEIIDLNEKDFDLFISFLNLNDEILKNTSDLELSTFIKDKFDHFKSINLK